MSGKDANMKYLMLVSHDYFHHSYLCGWWSGHIVQFFSSAKIAYRLKKKSSFIEYTFFCGSYSSLCVWIHSVYFKTLLVTFKGCITVAMFLDEAIKINFGVC